MYQTCTHANKSTNNKRIKENEKKRAISKNTFTPCRHNELEKTTTTREVCVVDVVACRPIDSSLFIFIWSISAAFAAWTIQTNKGGQATSKASRQWSPVVVVFVFYRGHRAWQGIVELAPCFHSLTLVFFASLTFLLVRYFSHHAVQPTFDSLSIAIPCPSRRIRAMARN